MVPGVEGSSPFTHPTDNQGLGAIPIPDRFSTQGCSQVVRQGTLTPSFAGSSPAIPAKVYPEGRTGMIGCLPSCENKPSAPLAQSVEHLPFKQGVRGSNPRRGTKKQPPIRVAVFWCLPFLRGKNGAACGLFFKHEGKTRRGDPPIYFFWRQAAVRRCLMGKLLGRRLWTEICFAKSSRE